MKWTFIVLAWLAVGVVVARAYVATQSGFDKEFESTGARAGINVVLWPLPAIMLVLMAIGLLVNVGQKRRW